MCSLAATIPVPLPGEAKIALAFLVLETQPSELNLEGTEVLYTALEGSHYFSTQTTSIDYVALFDPEVEDQQNTWTVLSSGRMLTDHPKLLKYH